MPGPAAAAHSKSAGAGKARVRSRRLLYVAAALIAYSAFEYATSGEVRWLGSFLNTSGQSVVDYARNPDASWRKAVDGVDGLGSAREGVPAPTPDLRGRVVRVADGDTVSLLDSNNKQHKIRFFGVDAPERDQPHGEEARRALAQLVEDRNVGVVIVETDNYGRTVGTLYLQDTNVNHFMVASGHAWWYRYHAPHELHLEAAEKSARQQGLGLWGRPAPIPPWDWRRGRR
ncbi:MAG: thermonuclease family protein [Gammaproteobacteria bacterium]|nr:thermonuclease family protein [Gammaproteobacteria bacterium]